MHDPVDDVGGVVVRGRLDRLDAAALVDRYVHDHGALLHAREHAASHEQRRPGTGDEHGADDQVCPGQDLHDVPEVARHRLDGPAEDVVQVLQPCVVDVMDRHPGPEAEGDLGVVGTNCRAAKHDDLAGVHAWDAALHHTGPAVSPLDVVRAHLWRHAARYLAHGSEEGQGAVRLLDRLVCDGGGAGFEQCVRQGSIGRQVEVRDEDEVFAQVAVLALNGLFDLEHHLLGPGLLRADTGAGTRGRVVIVGEARAGPGSSFDADPVTGRDQSLDGARSGSYSALLGLDLLDDAN